MLHLDIMFSNEYFQFPLKWAENHSHYLLLWSDVLSPVSRPIKASLHAGRYFYSDSQVALRCMLADLALVQKSTVRAMRLTWMILIFIWTIHNSLGLIISWSVEILVSKWLSIWSIEKGNNWLVIFITTITTIIIIIQ